MNQQTEGMLGRNFEELSNQRTPFNDTIYFKFDSVVQRTAVLRTADSKQTVIKLRAAKDKGSSKVEGKRLTGNDISSWPSFPELAVPRTVINYNCKFLSIEEYLAQVNLAEMLIMRNIDSFLLTYEIYPDNLDEILMMMNIDSFPDSSDAIC